MKPRKQKRYETPAQIKAAIIRLEAEAKELEQSAASMDSQANEYVRMANLPDNVGKSEWMISESNTLRTKAGKLRVRVNGIRKNRIASLGRTLAALQTEPMPFLNGDRSVALEK